MYYLLHFSVFYTNMKACQILVKDKAKVHNCIESILIQTYSIILRMNMKSKIHSDKIHCWEGA